MEHREEDNRIEPKLFLNSIFTGSVSLTTVLNENVKLFLLGEANQSITVLVIL